MQRGAPAMVEQEALGSGGGGQLAGMSVHFLADGSLCTRRRTVATGTATPQPSALAPMFVVHAGCLLPCKR